ncbi:DNA-binding transcriptional LysR family regulator [Desulfobotulus alkaliphilus]|uniref:DNA-binding transcriptional LysR family regulator n=1 Tax=Desulfobotulus alkaliphilus TaxID=622671 RepID=A0A562RA62_9BACT|nr:LysR family transcriptional regulator [Desulfobotulus alkaliphilus]TWI65793.1 DNA-binding transcriptional LysR family regulator [Desulfobotulus alkaliphilus]
MTFRQLELFLALARTPHVRKVAEQHFLTQAAVSSALKELENEVGIPLFDRLNRRLVLNENGRALSERLGPLMQQFHDTIGLFKGERMSGHMHIGASATIADYVLPQILYHFRDLYPDVAITTTSANSSEITQSVENGKLDMGFVEGEVQSTVVMSAPIGEEEMVIVSSDAGFARKGPYKIASLLSKRWLLREPGSGTRDTFLQGLGDQAVNLNVFLEFDHTESVKRVLQNPDTLSCMSPYAIEPELLQKKLFIVKVKDLHFPRKFYRLLHRDKYETRPMETFSRMIQAILNK